MNPNATTAEITTAAPSSHRGRKVIAALLLLAALAGSAVTFAPNRAEASTNANVSFCFAHPSGSPAIDYPVKLHVWTNSGWQVYRNGKSNSKGCGVFYSVPRNHYFTVTLAGVVGDGSFCHNGYPDVFVLVEANAPQWVLTNGTGNHYVGKAWTRTTYLCGHR